MYLHSRPHQLQYLEAEVSWSVVQVGSGRYMSTIGLGAHCPRGHARDAQGIPFPTAQVPDCCLRRTTSYHNSMILLGSQYKAPYRNYREAAQKMGLVVELEAWVAKRSMSHWRATGLYRPPYPKVAQQRDKVAQNYKPLAFGAEAVAGITYRLRSEHLQAAAETPKDKTGMTASEYH